MIVKSLDKKENSTAQLIVEIEKEKFQDALNQAYKKNKNNIFVPAFRTGKAPRKIVEGMYGNSIFYEDAVTILYPEVLTELIERQDLNIVGSPSIDNLDVDGEGALLLTFALSLYPEVELGEYLKLEAEKPLAEVSDGDIDAEINALLDRNSRLVSAEREIKDGDTAVIDFEGFEGGVAFEGGKGEKHNLVIGSGSFVPGFEDQLIGLKSGDSKDVELTFPEDYAEHLAGKDVVFKCYVHEVKETIKPELDDEFAKDVSEYDTVDELKESIKERLLKQREEVAKTTFENNILTKIVEDMKAEIPQLMIDEQIDKIVQNFSYQLQMSGMQMDDYLNMMGGDMGSMRQQYAPMALRQVQNDLVLGKIAELEDIQLTDEELENEYKRVAESYSMELEQIKSVLSSEDLSSDLKKQKALELVTESAVALPPEKEPELVEEVKAEPEKPKAKARKKADSEAAEKPAKKAKTAKAGKTEEKE